MQRLQQDMVTGHLGSIAWETYLWHVVYAGRQAEQQTVPSDCGARQPTNLGLKAAGA